MEITKAKFSMPKGTVEPGDRKFVLVWINRVDFKGPVTVTLEGLPDGVKSQQVVFPPNVDSDQISFSVSFGTEPITKEIRVVAECKEERARAEFPLTLNVTAPRKK